jgi:hypothetical protein
MGRRPLMSRQRKIAVNVIKIEEVKQMFNGKDELTIIQEDIKRAVQKPDTRWAMLIDLRNAPPAMLHVGCMVEQKSPPGIKYRPVYEEEIGTFPKVKRRFTPRLATSVTIPLCRACPNKGRASHLEEHKRIKRRNCDDQL